jgi:hypothetical protein
LPLTLTLPARRDSIVACSKKGGDRRVRRLPYFTHDRSTISTSSRTIWPAAIVPRVTVWSPIACSPTRPSPGLLERRRGPAPGRRHSCREACRSVALLRSRTMPETRGLMKALVEADGDRILRFTMLGAEAGKVMAVVHTRWWRLCPTRACATRLSRTREWQRASAHSSRMYWPDRARQDIGTAVTSSGTPTLTERQAMHCAGAPLGPEWVRTARFLPLHAQGPKVRCGIR